ncbi:MAG: polysaccharide biosynthesis protein, partial [Micrococcaceae bacterium]|nr:polysaccharide biosynthesis protein [Micrococcaceae bacterium]
MSTRQSPDLPKTASSDRILWLGSQFLLDAVAWVIAIIIAMILRYEMTFDPAKIDGVAIIAAVAIVSQLVVGTALSLY